jgi:hypothetical protein
VEVRFRALGRGVRAASVVATLGATVALLAGCSSPKAGTAGGSTSVPGSSTSITGHPTSTTRASVRPKNWSNLESVSRGSAIGAVECPATNSCVALADNGDAYHFEDGRWSGATQTGGASGASGGPSLSCKGPSFCMAVWRGGDDAVSWNGGSWSAPAAVPGAQALQAVGCGSLTFCVTVDGIGAAFYFDGSGWSEGSQDWGSVTSISCASASFCISVQGGVSMWNGSSWTEPTVYGTSSELVGVSCPSPSFCATVDSTGDALLWNGTRWSGPRQLASAAGAIGGPSLSGLSCSGPDFCVAVDSAGAAFSWNGRSWSPPETADPGHALTAVSCATASFCIATDHQGFALKRT